MCRSPGRDFFVVCVRDGIAIPDHCRSEVPSLPVAYQTTLPANTESCRRGSKANWIWWNMPAPLARRITFADLIEEDGSWFSKKETGRLIAMMSEANLAKLQEAKNAGRRIVGGLYRRMRRDESGNKVQARGDPLQ